MDPNQQQYENENENEYEDNNEEMVEQQNNQNDGNYNWIIWNIKNLSKFYLWLYEIIYLFYY